MTAKALCEHLYGIFTLIETNVEVQTFLIFGRPIDFTRVASPEMVLAYDAMGAYSNYKLISRECDGAWNAWKDEFW